MILITSSAKDRNTFLKCWAQSQCAFIWKKIYDTGRSVKVKCFCQWDFYFERKHQLETSASALILGEKFRWPHRAEACDVEELTTHRGSWDTVTVRLCWPCQPGRTETSAAAGPGERALQTASSTVRRQRNQTDPAE